MDGFVVVYVVGSELLVGGLACLQFGHDSLSLVESAADQGASACAGQLVALATLDVYSHAVPGLQEEAANKAASLIFDG